MTGLASPPSILTIRPFSTVTSRVQASGQSSGQAVRTACPDGSADVVRMGNYRMRTAVNVQCSMFNGGTFGYWTLKTFRTIERIEH